jgi:hypothetical protein
MTDEQVRQLEQVLESRFFPYILERQDGSVKGWTAQQHKTNRLSRCLAGFSVSKLTFLDDVDVCNAVVDGADDNGIDAVCFDRSAKQLILVQSKFSQGREPDLADTLKFIEGVNNLFERRFEHFNPAFQLKLPEILNAFDEPDLQVVIALAHLGGELSRHVMPRMNDLITKLNRDKARATFQNLNASQLYQILTQEHTLPVINDVIELNHWIISRTTPRILYGQISAKQLAALFQKHGKNVFAKNIRNYVGSSEVNNAITKTMHEEPELFIHLNNGLTIVCERFAPRAGAVPEKGMLDLYGLSIVNGAQTVGSIAHAAKEIDLADSPAKLLVTVIESTNAPADFEVRVTQARNTQNRVNASDFASQDVTQERLRREMAISGITYIYKPSDETIPPETSTVKLGDAAIA